MCGLVGAMVAANHMSLSKNELDRFTNLLYCSALRGAHSTGIMWWDGHQIKHMKMAAHPADFIYTKEYNSVLEPGKIKAIFGHTRYATSGKINAKNAHPFKVGNKIVMMHNGNVQKVEGSNVTEFEVDSMALANSLATKPVEKVFESFDGAVACIWFDVPNMTVNFYRNYQRPLWMTDSHITNYYASEEDMLQWVIGRPTFPNSSKNTLKLIELPPMHLHKVSLKEIDKKVDFQKIERRYGTTFYNSGSNYKRHFNKYPWGGDDEFEYADDESEIVVRSVADRPIYLPQQNTPAVIRSNRKPTDEELNQQLRAAVQAITESPKEPEKPKPRIKLAVVNKRANMPPTADEILAAAEHVNTESSFLSVPANGPFEVGKEMHFALYQSEVYGEGSAQRWKLRGNVILGPKDKIYDIPTYNSAMCEAYNFSEVEAIKHTGQFVTAKVANIRYNKDYVDDCDRLLVYLSDVRILDGQKGEVANGN